MTENEPIVQEEAAQPYPAQDAIPGENPDDGSEGKGWLFILGLFCGLLLALITVLAAALLFGARIRAQIPSGGAVVDTATNNKIEQINGLIDRNFYRTGVDDDVLRDGIYRGMLDSLGDKYSEYYSAEEYKEIAESYEGAYYGIGAYMVYDDDLKTAVIAGTIEGSPAEKAGLMEDDIITEIDGVPAKGLDLNSIVSRVRGEEGTKVHLKLDRDGKDIEVDIVRARIEADTVKWEAVDEEGIGYLRIIEFDSVTPGQFKEGLNALRDEGIRGMILDLRNNTGGDFDACCEIADELLPEGLIVYAMDKYGDKEEFTSDEKNKVDFPIVVLTNGYTASASEVLSGAIRDSGIGKLVGTTTFGKGVIQNVYELKDGSAVKITVQNYFTPSGYDLNGVGLLPDVEIEADTEAYKKDKTDNQLERGKEVLREMMGH